MREILFRGKDVDNNKWFYGFYEETASCCIDPPMKYICIRERLGDLHTIYPETLGQFTGLYDKNGKMIFEGDIVKCKLVDRIFEKGKWEHKIVYENYEVIYSTEYIGFRLKGDDDIVSIYGCELEVIGNIYDEEYIKDLIQDGLVEKLED